MGLVKAFIAINANLHDVEKY